MAHTRDYQDRPARPNDGRTSITIDEDGYQIEEPLNGPDAERDDLRVVRKNEIGAGGGLDEAELARVDPLDGEAWDGEEDEEEE